MKFNLLKENKTTSEQKFWNWFLKNKIGLEKFMTSDNDDYTLYDRLTKEMKKYDSHLFPEMTMTEKDEYVLIITPDGISKGVLPTQKLFNGKPEINNWIIKKFRQATDEIALNFDGIEYPSSDITILTEIDNERGKINIRVFIRNMKSDEKRYQSLAWLYLDHILGEFNTITMVGYVDFFNLEKNMSVDGGISILDLRKLIETELYKVDL